VSQHIEIPSPRRLPFVGNGLSFMSRNVPSQFAAAVSSTPDGLVLLHFPKSVSPVPIILCASAEATRELFDDDRFPKFVFPTAARLVPAGIFTTFTHDPVWAPIHRQVLPALSGPQVIRDLPILHAVARQLTDLVVSQGPRDGLVNIEDALTRAAFDAICQIALRTNYGALNRQTGPAYFDAIQQATDESVAESVQIPWLWKLNFRRHRRQAATAAFARKEADVIIEHRRRLGTEAGADDLLARLLWEADPETGQVASEDAIRDQVLSVSLIGQDTTKSLMTWALYHLSAHPEIQRQVQDEIDSITGGDQSRPLSAGELSQLHVLDRVLSETLRITQPLGTVNRYAAREETLLGKYRVPQGSLILFLRDLTHRDPAYWSDPQRFDPDRWLPERLATIVPGSYSPFGGGIRACIGQGFAHMEALTFLSTLLRAATFHLNGEYSLDLSPKHVSSSPTALKALRVVRREPKSTAPAHSNQPASGCPYPSPVAASDDDLPDGLSPGTAGALTIAYGSEGGTCHQIARRIAREAMSMGLATTITPLDAIVGALPIASPFVIVSSSYNGAPPSNAREFLRYLKSGDAELSSMRAAVLGVGDPAWHLTYQAVPTEMDGLLRQAGCTPMIERGALDVSQDFSADYLTWTASLWQTLGLSAPAQDQRLGSVAELTVTRTHHPALDTVDDGVSNGYVTLIRDLHSPGVPAQDRRATRHIEIVLPEGMTYETGDHLIVHGFNHRITIDRALDVLGIDAAEIIEITAGDSAGTWLPTGVPLGARFLFGGFIDFGQPMSRRQMPALAQALSGSAADAVSALAALSPEDFERQVFDRRMTLLDILTEAGKPTISLAVALSLLSPLRRRRYSISSSPLDDPRIASITVGVVRGPALSGHGTFRGVASTYLAGVEAGRVLKVAVASSSGFQPPDDASLPIIMIGAGTGIAPFRGFAQHRAGQRAQGHPIGEALLLAGCRRSDEDRLYGDEWEAFERDGILNVTWAYSREPRLDAAGNPTGEISKTYVQDLVIAEHARIFDMLSRGAVIYVCGDALGMAVGVRASLGVDVVDELRARGQYVEDVWSSTFAHA
jgi:cytochrome P450/NADPH-cytochrome P450 reductase